MPKTARVDYLLKNFGYLSDAEVEEVEKLVGRPTDYVPIIPGTDHDPVREPEFAFGGPSYNEVPEPRYSTSKAPGSLIKDDRPPTFHKEDFQPDQVRLAQLEATVKDLFAKVSALERRLGVGKDST
jgi:hypothetical protein